MAEECHNSKLINKVRVTKRETITTAMGLSSEKQPLLRKPSVVVTRDDGKTVLSLDEAFERIGHG